MAGITARRVVVALDCSNARVLAEFYASMLGWRISDGGENPDWVDILPPEGESGALALACQTVLDFLNRPRFPAASFSGSSGSGVRSGDAAVMR